MSALPHPPPSQPVSGKRAEVTYDSVKQLLIRGEFQRGERLSVNALGERFTVSRQPVLAALNRLSHEGFVRVVPQVGFWVADVDATEVGDFFRMFALTEGLSAALAAERRTPDGVYRLRAILGQFNLLLGGTHPAARLQGEFFALNRQFHSAIHAMAHSAYVARMAAGMWDRCDFYLTSANPLLQGERAQDSEREHESIVQAIADGKASVAQKRLRDHIEAIGDEAVRRL
jgi:DNA-binding GntR family transcriptional regulator